MGCNCGGDSKKPDVGLNVDNAEKIAEREAKKAEKKAEKKA